MITTTYHSFFLDSKSPKLSCRLVVTTIAYDYNNNIYIYDFVCTHFNFNIYTEQKILFTFFFLLFSCVQSVHVCSFLLSHIY